jgi:hypothetical protein
MPAHSRRTTVTDVDVLARQLYRLIEGDFEMADRYEVLKVGWLITNGMYTPDVCEKCGQAPPRPGRSHCEGCLTVDI